jgi:hypothetical protein
VTSLINIAHLNAVCGVCLGGFRIRKIARRCGLGESEVIMSVA